MSFNNPPRSTGGLREYITSANGRECHMCNDTGFKNLGTILRFCDCRAGLAQEALRDFGYRLLQFKAAE